MDQHDQPHGREDFLAVPEDEPAAHGPAPRSSPPRRRVRVRPLAMLGVAVLAGGVLAGVAVMDDQRQGRASGGALAAGTTPTPTASTPPPSPSGDGTGGTPTSPAGTAPPSPTASGTGTAAPVPDAAPPGGATDRGADDHGGRQGWLGLGGLLDGDAGDGRGGRGGDHDGDHLVGTLSSVDASSIVVDAPSGQQSLAVGAGTEVVRDHQHASTADLAVGQDVLVRVSAAGDSADLVVVDPDDR